MTNTQSRWIRTGKYIASAAAASVMSPAFASVTLLPAQEWSSYLLFGSIALLVAAMVGKMITYRSHSAPDSPVGVDDGSSGIGVYRNSVLSPGR